MIQRRVVIFFSFLVSRLENTPGKQTLVRIHKNCKYSLALTSETETEMYECLTLHFEKTDVVVVVVLTRSCRLT